MTQRPTILAFAASNSEDSINRRLAIHAAERLAAEILPEGADIAGLDLNDYEMPIYSPRREKDGGVPDLAHAFRARIAEADAVILSLAEHNGTFTAAFKNLFDWTSRIDRSVYQDKPMLLLATSPGARGAQTVLAYAADGAPRFGADLRGALSVPSFGEVFDKEAGVLTDPDLQAALHKVLVSLAEGIADARAAAA